MNTRYIKSYLSNLCKGAVNQANINSKELQAIPIFLPPIPLQHEFASKIEAIEKQKELIKRSIAEVETLLASRMQYYFGQQFFISRKAAKLRKVFLGGKFLAMTPSRPLRLCVRKLQPLRERLFSVFFLSHAKAQRIAKRIRKRVFVDKKLCALCIFA